MKKFTAFALSILTIVPFVAIAWVLYYNFHSTPVAIINLLIVMTGVLLAFIVYNRTLISNDENVLKIDMDHFPYIESALIYVMPQDFVSKLDKNTGHIFIAASEETIDNVTLVDGNFDKLTDTITLKYTNGITTTVRGSRTVAVGDNQFLFYGFDELIHKKGSKKSIFQWEDDRLIQKNGNEIFPISIPDRMPVYVFDWK
ncbi:hypothetical protein CW751_08980 [Brumimicrobium salinarum]|uniref:Uncharacterized protein n=1 Tax=Brumimicrobium salinarum TaxID=2058658 RepID=A0A2I0R278_9FLAO|nr:hypothetical protein [Brumimicrobium salinarum]PKR80500.1 hypothetical protein CW751_08980 [Brumimicrobium salinarum]